MAPACDVHVIAGTVASTPRFPGGSLQVACHPSTPQAPFGVLAHFTSPPILTQ
jgi:hypothetical protein